jgi:hypothetical protein
LYKARTEGPELRLQSSKINVDPYPGKFTAGLVLFCVMFKAPRAFMRELSWPLHSTNLGVLAVPLAADCRKERTCMYQAAEKTPWDQGRVH